MKQLIKILFSSQLMIILLIVFGGAIGGATFIENTYDIATAKSLVYNSLWFEIVFLLLILNFIGHVIQYNLFTIQRLPGFIMHSAFIIIIIGAGISRFTGFEGSMHIREGESSNLIYTDIPYLQIKAEDSQNEYSYDLPLEMSEIFDNSFQTTIKTEDKGDIKIAFHEYIKNAEEVLMENETGGVDMLEVIVMSGTDNKTVIIDEGMTQNIGGLVFTYNNDKTQGAINVMNKDNKLIFSSIYDISQSQMPAATIDTIPKGLIAETNFKEVYNVNGLAFAFSKVYKKAKRVLVSKDTEERGIDVIVLDVEFAGKKKEVSVFGGKGYVANFQDATIDGIKLKMAYGDKPIEIPFSLILKDFVLDRYSGSMSPSSFASDVVLVDARNGLKEDHRIFMNNVLDYDGYRFFQSSYDQDEQGTVLSVNHDYYGTMFTYAGYFLMALGFILTFTSKHSRFLLLRKCIRDIRIQRKATLLSLTLILCFSSISFSQEVKPKPLDKEHAEKFGQLIVQSFDGRFEPLHSQANSVMHKISRMDGFNTPEKGEMNNMQVYMDMFLNAEYWKDQKIIYVSEESVKDVLGIKGKYASFNDFYTMEQHNQNHETGQQEQHNHAAYKLQDLSETAFRKKQADQTKFDKEIIKVDERVNICMMIYQGSMLKIFPEPNSPNNKWISWDENAATIPLTGAVTVINSDLQLEKFDYNNILRIYFSEVFGATTSGDYSRADKILGYISEIQRNSDASSILPTQRMVDFEINYNNSQIFITLKNWYGILSVILLLLAFIENLKSKRSKLLSLSLNFFIILLGGAFLYHTYGMCVRWYLTGHAPWSNGYEALLLIAWGSLLAGFSFVRNSKITLAATSLLAFLMLMTASHSSYDPQLTNLQPVLKSYWLIIHVAVITISYGFLGLGFILGIMNMFIFLFTNSKNEQKLDFLTTELTYINEISLAIGLVLLSCGTFLGGVWANESWGRYWGWDAKETWSLVMMVAYTIILHLRLVPRLQSKFIFNIGSIVGFATLCMTFIGVNYYLAKGMHSYGSGDTPIFPLWAWGLIISIIVLVISAGLKLKLLKK